MCHTVTRLLLSHFCICCFALVHSEYFQLEAVSCLLLPNKSFKTAIILNLIRQMQITNKMKLSKDALHCVGLLEDTCGIIVGKEILCIWAVKRNMVSAVSLQSTF